MAKRTPAAANDGGEVARECVDAGRFHFKPLTEDDLPIVRGWLLRPHVAEWWGPVESMDELREAYVTHADEARATRAYLAHDAGRPIGFIQCYAVMGSGDGWWEDETDSGARGIDQFLAEADDLGKGLGRSMIRSFVAMLFRDPSVSVVQTDPDPDNVRAIRCYRAAGFLPVGVVETPDGPALLLKQARR